MRKSKYVLIGSVLAINSVFLAACGMENDTEIEVVKEVDLTKLTPEEKQKAFIAALNNLENVKTSSVKINIEINKDESANPTNELFKDSEIQMYVQENENGDVFTKIDFKTKFSIGDIAFGYHLPYHIYGIKLEDAMYVDLKPILETYSDLLSQIEKQTDGEVDEETTQLQIIEKELAEAKQDNIYMKISSFSKIIDEDELNETISKGLVDVFKLEDFSTDKISLSDKELNFLNSIDGFNFLAEAEEDMNLDITYAINEKNSFDKLNFFLKKQNEEFDGEITLEMDFKNQNLKFSSENAYIVDGNVYDAEEGTVGYAISYVYGMVTSLPIKFTFESSRPEYDSALDMGQGIVSTEE